MQTLEGKGFVAIWNGITPGHESDFERWHVEEHMPERLAIPGFEQGQRWGASEKADGYFTLYTLESPAVARSDAYLSRLNDPTPWTRRTMAQFTNNSRCVGTFSQSTGELPSETMLVVRLHGDFPPVEVSAVMAIEGVTGCHLGQSDTATSALPTVERQGRMVAEPSGLVLISISEATEITRIQASLEALFTDLQPASVTAFHRQLSVS